MLFVTDKGVSHISNTSLFCIQMCVKQTENLERLNRDNVSSYKMCNHVNVNLLNKCKSILFVLSCLFLFVCLFLQRRHLEILHHT